MEFRRYAVYYTPPAGALADFGAAWLGWDVATGLPVQHPIVHGLSADIEPMTRTPRKYGFHGTVKPPFFLAQGQDISSLTRAVGMLCADLAPVEMTGLQLSRLGRFLALTPTGDTSGLAALAARTVKDLDAFRAPPSAAELERRRKARLSDRQEQNLLAWGYPYVMEDFRFHLTLTGRLENPDAEHLMECLEPALVNTLPRPFIIDDLALVGEDDAGMFHEIKRFPLARDQKP